MDDQAGSARRDDISRVRSIAVKYIPHYEGDADLPKVDRGWRNEHTARMLCPQNKLTEFEEDWDR